MVERLQGRRFIQPADQVQRPERLEGELPGFVRDHPLQLRHDRRILAVADQPAVPSAASICWDRTAALTSSGVLSRDRSTGLTADAGIASLEPVDPPIARVDLSLVVAVVVDLAVVPIGDVEIARRGRA